MTTAGQITRTRVVLRAKYGWPKKTVPFAHGAFHSPDGYQTNAAGYVSMCWDIPLDAPHSRGGMSIVSLLTDNWCHEIKPSDLKPGDAIGYLGPEAVDSDGGTVVIFEKWLNDDPSLGVALTWDHLPVVGAGPDRRAHPVDFRWHAYRYRHIIDDPVPAENSVVATQR